MGSINEIKNSKKSRNTATLNGSRAFDIPLTIFYLSFNPFYSYFLISYKITLFWKGMKIPKYIQDFLGLWRELCPREK